MYRFIGFRVHGLGHLGFRVLWGLGYKVYGSVLKFF